MTSKIFLVTRYDFDRLENRQPVITEQIGYVYSPKELDAWIKNQNFKYYTGYNSSKTLYPYFILTEIKHL